MTILKFRLIFVLVHYSRDQATAQRSDCGVWLLHYLLTCPLCQRQVAAGTSLAVVPYYAIFSVAWQRSLTGAHLTTFDDRYPFGNVCCVARIWQRLMTGIHLATFTV